MRSSDNDIKYFYNYAALGHIFNLVYLKKGQCVKSKHLKKNIQKAKKLKAKVC